MERIFIAQEVAVFYSADFFSHNDFLGFSTMDNVFTKIIGLIPNMRASELFMYEYVPGMVQNGGWNVNGYFAHEAYSNFGIVGVWLGSIYGGVMNAILCIYFRTSRKTELSLCFYSFFAISVTTLISNFNAMLFNTQLILLFIIYLFFKACDRKRKNDF